MLKFVIPRGREKAGERVSPVRLVKQYEYETNNTE